jgi:hypothetical protein
MARRLWDWGVGVWGHPGGRMIVDQKKGSHHAVFICTI